MDMRVDTWNRKLSKLTVQNKFLDITELEAKNRVWNQIQAGLPTGQLSFLLKAGSDTLPAPLNLKRGMMRVDSKCPLCDHYFPTTHHILSNCPTSLQQGRYTWRHDSALKILASGIKTILNPEARLIADLLNLRATDNPPSTIPSEILDTTTRPDIMIIQQHEITLLDLTVPFNSPEGLANAKHCKECKENYQLVGTQPTLPYHRDWCTGTWASTHSLILSIKLFPSIPKSELQPVSSQILM